MPKTLFGLPTKFDYNLFKATANKKKKRTKLTSAQRIFIWEHPNLYGRVCSICHYRITKMSDLELDHTRAHSKGGKKLALAHRDCNRMKRNGSLRKIQKTLGLRVTKKSKSRKKRRRKRREYDMFGLPKIKPIKWGI